MQMMQLNGKKNGIFVMFFSVSGGKSQQLVPRNPQTYENNQFFWFRSFQKKRVVKQGMGKPLKPTDQQSHPQLES